MDLSGMEFCERHGSSPGGGICAVCLQEKLILLWRGEGQNANWDTEEFCVTPPPVLEEDQERPEHELEEDNEEPRVVGPSSSSSFACFPIRFRVSKKDESHEREKVIDRSQFSCELKSILKELAALHDKKKRRNGTESGNSSSRRPPHHDQGGETEAVVPRAKASIVEEDDEEEEARYRKVMCFSAMWPAILNMKWARVVVSPILSSNKIAPSKSDLLSKVDPQRQESGRNCETSGSEQHLQERAPTPAALLPPQYYPADNEDGGQELDKETKLRMEASRITVMTWLQSLPSPKAVHLEHHNLKGLEPDDLSLGNGVLEMCDEEEVETFDHRHSQEIDVYAHMASFGKFLQSSPQIAYAPPRMVDIEIAAQ